MKASLILAAALALSTTAAFAQTTPTTPSTSGSMNSGTMGNGTMNNGNGSMNSTTGRMSDMNGTDKSTMRNNKRMSKKGMKTKTDTDGSMKTKM